LQYHGQKWSVLKSLNCRYTDVKVIPNNLENPIEIFELFGCTYIRKKGSHHILRCPEAKRAAVVPECTEIDVDIIKNNMQTAGMSRERYFELIDQI